MPEPLRVTQITRPSSPKTLTEAPYYSNSLEDMQRWFDVTAEYLQTQAGQSASSPTSQACLYQAPDGNKCAIGFHIPDDYRATLSTLHNGSAAGSLINKHPKLRGIAFPEGQLDLAQDMQTIHDKPVYRTEGRLNARGREGLRRIARRYGLSDERVGF